MYDLIRKWKNRIMLVLNSILLNLKRYKNISFKGKQNIHYSTQIYGRMNGKVILGKRISTCRDCALVAVGGVLQVGDYCGFSENCSIVSHEKIMIGDNCIFGPNTCVYDHDHRFGFEGVMPGYKTSPIIIGENCWVGANATILRGTTIGDGCIIGAGTVVKGNIPAHSIVKNNRELIIKMIKED